MCKARKVPVFRFCCPRCFRSMPCPMRESATQAWRTRVTAPDVYAETLAGVLLWFRDYRTEHQEKQLGERE